MARQFNGNSITTPSLTHGIGSGEWTVSMWVWADSFSVDSVIFNGGVLNPGFYCNSSGNVISYFGGAGTTFTGTLSTGQWVHLMFSRISDTVRLWINGTQNATTQNVAGKSWPDNYFMMAADSVGGGDGWDGALGEIAVWKGVGFGDDEAAMLAAGTSPEDVSPKGGTRLSYAPFIGAGSTTQAELDRWGGFAWTPNIDAGIVAHPKINRKPPARLDRLGTAAAAGAISCSISAGASVSAALSGAGALAAAIAGAGAVAATLSGAGALATSIDGAAGVTAALTGAGALACAIDGTGAVVCTVTQPGAIATAIDGSASVSATLVGAGALAAAVAGAATVTATLEGAGALALAATGSASVTASLTDGVPVDALGHVRVVRAGGVRVAKAGGYRARRV